MIVYKERRLTNIHCFIIVLKKGLFIFYSNLEIFQKELKNPEKEE